MLEPELVASCCAAMAAATSVPITVKCRLGATPAPTNLGSNLRSSPNLHFNCWVRLSIKRGLQLSSGNGAVRGFCGFAAMCSPGQYVVTANQRAGISSLVAVWQA